MAPADQREGLIRPFHVGDVHAGQDWKKVAEDRLARADVILVPALSVDAGGHRLGRGGGSYDRALARVSAQVPTIALVYDTELVPALPTDPHDQQVRAVARPSHGLTWF